MSGIGSNRQTRIRARRSYSTGSYENSLVGKYKSKKNNKIISTERNEIRQLCYFPYF